MSLVEITVGELRSIYDSLKPVMTEDERGHPSGWDKSRWHPEVCVYNRHYNEKLGIGCHMSCFEACKELQYEGTLGDSRWQSCRKCRDIVPALIIVKEMIDYCEKWEDDHYTLAKCSPYFKCLKDYLPKEVIESECMTFYTFVPHDRLSMDDETLGKMKQFCKDLFECEIDEKGNKRVKWSMWVVESGKHASKPNPHIHALVKYHPNGSKNYMARERDKLWRAQFPSVNHRLDWKRGNDHKGIEYRNLNCKKLQQQKIDYMDNEKKHLFGEDHTNFIDLGIKGGLSS